MNTITFYSNYFNHHQKALCEAFYEILGDGFTFVETMPMEEFRTGMGWGEETPSYVLRTYESNEAEDKAKRLGITSELVIMGTAPEYYIEPRIAGGGIVFRYSERPLKEGFIKFFIPRLTKKYIHLHVRNRKKNIYVLAASAFASYDFAKMFGSYRDKCYKFAYFPKHISYDINDLFERKKKASRASGAVTVLWLGRMIRLKRADLVITAVARLYALGYDLRLKMIGDGEEKDRLVALAKRLGIEGITTFEGFLAPDEAREQMADAEIYAMTSNKLEGWGSVIYEALNAGCAVVASSACGATPWLVKDNETGLVFKSGSAECLAARLKLLLEDEDTRHRLGECAYKQMKELWNPKVAAGRTIRLYEAISEGCDTPFTDGPLSKAEIIRNNWYRG